MRLKFAFIPEGAEKAEISERSKERRRTNRVYFDILSLYRSRELSKQCSAGIYEDDEHASTGFPQRNRSARTQEEQERSSLNKRIPITTTSSHESEQEPVEIMSSIAIAQ